MIKACSKRELRTSQIHVAAIRVVYFYHMDLKCLQFSPRAGLVLFL
jgi:hypothetical protein